MCEGASEQTPEIQSSTERGPRAMALKLLDPRLFSVLRFELQ